ncbi:MAG: TonB-dependent receptor [Acidobacteria bacterium]|nr:TonB-dependent receptor [Acidobacteriota bacterium]
MLLRIFLIGGLLVSAAVAQMAGMRGQVSDESGAVVPGAKVVLRGAVNRTATADATGTFNFTGLPAGDYTVQASSRGLVQAQPAKVTLQGATQTTVNLVLRVAGRTDAVTVQENGAPALTTEGSGNASAVVLSGQDLDALSDDPDDLAADLQALAGPSAGPNGGAIFVDGFSGGELPPKASIREVRINQNPFSAEYDKLGYGRVEIFTKPGTDKYRGSLQWNTAHDAWNTRNPYSAEKAPFLLNEFENNFGGPMGKHASFTLDLVRNMVDNGTITNGVWVDPATLLVQPFSGFVTVPGRFLNVSPRVDYQLNEKNTLMFRYGVTHSDVVDNGIGGFDRTARGYHSQFTNQTAQVGDTLVVGTVINETRFQYYRSASQAIANTLTPEVQVLGAFNDGGATLGRTFDTQNNYEFQNYTSMLHKAHSLRFGVRLRAQTDDSAAPQNFNGTFTFGGGNVSSVDQYRLTLLYQGMGYAAQQIRALGGGATQFSITTGAPETSVRQVDVSLFAGDEWRLRPNLTLGLGLRYEAQTNIQDSRDIAPRVAIAWAPGATAKNPRTKTVLRAGFGMFYDRFPLSATLDASRFNGVVQRQFVVDNPDFFPNIPTPAMLAGYQARQVIDRVSSRLRAPYLMQTAVTVERQLPANSTLAVTFTNSRGVHMLRSFPLTGASPVFLRESSGVYRQNQMIANVNTKVMAGLSLFAFYVLNQARSNTDGLGTFPANPASSAGEYGPAMTDVRNRVTVGGSITLKGNVRISPFVVLQSGAPFNITTGSDLYGTSLFNARPGLATDPNRPGVVQTVYGLLDPNPVPGEALVPRNYGRGPGQETVNVRIVKTIGLGKSRESGAGEQRASAGGAAGIAAATTGRGLGGLIGNPTTSHRFNLVIGLSIRNLLNHTNPGAIIGNITSPLFGFANQVAGGPNGEGFYENANNRRLESQIKLTF